ncbi:hypothetical protein ABZ554_20895 [Streptomyces sp. NPDC020125]|uniref:hypothetical protein n=1 Tax=Streptomyces sp. NPDC020125 TaxID=3154593 RepID=UPI0033F42A38
MERAERRDRTRAGARCAVTDWLRERKRSHDVLDRSAATARRTAPAALVACGDDLMGRSDWKSAQAHFKRLLDQYPGDGLAARARTGAKKATLSIDLAGVRNLLAPGTGAQPQGFRFHHLCDVP